MILWVLLCFPKDCFDFITFGKETPGRIAHFYQITFSDTLDGRASLSWGWSQITEQIAIFSLFILMRRSFTLVASITKCVKTVLRVQFHSSSLPEKSRYLIAVSLDVLVTAGMLQHLHAVPSLVKYVCRGVKMMETRLCCFLCWKIIMLADSFHLCCYYSCSYRSFFMWLGFSCEYVHLKGIAENYIIFSLLHLIYFPYLNRYGCKCFAVGHGHCLFSLVQLVMNPP